MRYKTFAFFVILYTTIFPLSCFANSSEPLPTAGRSTLINGSTDATPHGEWKGTYQNTGVNFNSARQIQQGFLVRVKRLVKPGSDAAKEFARSIPLVSTAANWATLGIYKRALKSQGEAVRATWLSVNCVNKTFNVTGDGYSWQNIFKDQYGQAEDLYFHFCESADGQQKPLYTALRPADEDMLRAAQLTR
jgi:hypothetical protein